MERLLEYAAIDPMALILTGRAYIIWTEWKHPHEPLDTGIIARAMEGLTLDERAVVVARAKEMIAFGKAVVVAAGG